MKKAPFAFFRGIVIVIVAGLTAFFGASFAYQMVNGSLWYDVVGWIYGAFIFLIGFLFSTAGGRHRYAWIVVTMTPVFAFFVVLFGPKIFEMGRFSGLDFQYFCIYFLVMLGILVTGIGFGILTRKALCRVVPAPLCEQL